jgi:hypothetical protein
MGQIALTAGSPPRSSILAWALSKVALPFCAECGHEVVETLVEKETGKGLDAAAIWSAGLSAFSASGLSNADSD